jgi:tetratricopeptide (TPR) repeat protein
MLNKTLLISALAVLLLLGCSRQEQPKQAPVLTATQHQGGQSGQAPYYHGLVEEYRSVLAEDPNNLAALIGLGNAYYDLGEWKRAITMYEHALAIDSRNADVRTDMGTAYRSLGNSDRALAEYRAALEFEPSHLDARYNLGIVYDHDKKDYRAAVRVWEELLRLAPNYRHAPEIHASLESIRKLLKKGGP